MYWNHIMKAWIQFFVRGAALRQAAPKVDVVLDGPSPAAWSLGDAFEGERITPFIPDTHVLRNESSLHLSC